MVLEFAAAAAPSFTSAMPTGATSSLSGAAGGDLGSLISSLLGGGGTAPKEKKPGRQDELLKMLGGMGNPASGLVGQSQFSIPGSPTLGGLN